MPETSAQTSTGTANPSPVKRRRKRGATHYTQKKRRTVPPYYAMPGLVGIFRTNIQLWNIIFHIHFFKPCFIQIDNVFISGSRMQHDSRKEKGGGGEK